jgi:hypothetical protein
MARPVSVAGSVFIGIEVGMSVRDNAGGLKVGTGNANTHFPVVDVIFGRKF